MARVLPPDVSAESFDTAVAALREAIGDKWVLTDPDDVAPYHDKFPIPDGESHVPSMALQPGSVEDVQAIVRIANEHTIPLSPVSTGKNLGYGGAAPRLSGAAVVHLGKRMNRILEVNEKYAYALLEPGVTYLELYEYLQEHGYKLCVDPPDLGWGSVVGNTMDRGVGYTPYGDHAMWQTGLEVVLPDGDFMRTGMGALPGSNTWQLFGAGFGPSPDGMFIQSNYGIVTKMGIALMPEPPGAKSFLITFDKAEDLSAIIDTMLPLRINMAPLQNVPVLRNIILDAGVVSKRHDWYDGDGPLPDEAIERMKAELNLGYWNLYGTVYGPDPIMDQHLQIIKDAFTQIPGARFYTTDDRADPDDRGAHNLWDRHKINRGIPSLDEANIFEWVPNGGDFFFSPISAPDGADAYRQYEMVKRRTDEYSIDYATQFVVGLREMHHICLLPHNTQNPTQRESILALSKLLIDEAAVEGYGEYRTHLSLMDQVMGTYNYNDGALLRFNERIKDALDPNGIMAPGKSGIWGKAHRDKNN